MKFDKSILKLYAVTNFSHLDEEICIRQKILKAINGGVTCIQLREKDRPYEDYLNRALTINDICKRRRIPFIVNDNIEIAIESDADGIHVGQRDLNAREARKLIGHDKILGVSAQTVEQAMHAERDGADYLGVGSVFNTYTKIDASIVSLEILKKICISISIPVVAIGGINLKNVQNLNETGISGIAVSSSIFLSSDIEKSSKELLFHSKKIVKSGRFK